MRRTTSALMTQRFALNTIFGRQLLMIAAVIAPTLLFASMVIYLYAEAELRQSDQQRLAMARAVSEAINRQVDVEEATLRALRASLDFERGDWEAVYHSAKRILNDDPMRRLVLFDADGGEIFHTQKPFGAPLPRAAAPEYVVKALETGETQVSGLVTGAVVNGPVLGVYLPGQDRSGARHVIAMGVSPALIQGILSLQRPPPGTLMSVIDAKGRFIARSEQAEASLGRLASADYVAQVRATEEAAIETTAADGRRMRGAFTRSTSTGWSVGIGVDARVAVAELRASLLAIGGGGVLLVVAALATAGVLARRTARAITDLSGVATALGHGDPLPAVRSDLQEVNEVAEAMVKARDLLRRRAEELEQRTRELNESEARYRMIAENGRDMILFADAEGVIRYASPSSGVLLGFSPEALRGKPVEELIFPADRHVFEGFLAGLKSGEMEADFRHRAMRADGDLIWVEVSARAVQDPIRRKANGFIAGLRDVTARKSAEDRAVMAMAEAASSNRAKSDFLAQMSHELRTPLNAVIGFSQLLTYAQSSNLTEKQREYIGYITKAGEHLLQLVTDLLDLAKIDAGQLSIVMETVTTSTLLSDVQTMVRPSAAAADVVLKVNLEQSYDVLADRSRLAQVLLNFCSNAIKYNRPGGEVLVSASLTADGAVRICVEDTGVGIAEEEQRMLFQPFQRVGPDRGVDGAGIGLSIARRLVDLMGGRIGFSSVEDQGSAFWVDLPQVLAASALARPLQGEAPRFGVDDGRAFGGQEASTVQEAASPGP